MDVPDIRYASSGNASVAYRASGDGPVDLVVVRGSLSERSSVWDQPLFMLHEPSVRRRRTHDYPCAP
ncbi:MAG TPA: hypothetical protein VE011_10400 [Candidatus Dormibacteraeota bacterium]|nr:hypothetical protein [Candidatus Dormibacteraeota bacterium]